MNVIIESNLINLNINELKNKLKDDVIFKKITKITFKDSKRNKKRIFKLFGNDFYREESLFFQDLDEEDIHIKAIKDNDNNLTIELFKFVTDEFFMTEKEVIDTSYD